jgi:RNase adaptor protein for sRNA GlmZ degradation
MIVAYVSSFSFHFDEIPTDPFGHGGSFVFDCRYVFNPGRLEEYKDLDGLKKSVEKWLESNTSAQEFWKLVKNLIDFALKQAKEKDMTEISFHFGCSGGRHRSVFFAEKSKKYLESLGVRVIIEHIRLKKQGLLS